MKSSKAFVRSTILGAALATALPLAALAQTAALPEEPTHGSTQVSKQESESDLAKLATVGKDQAIAAAIQHTPGEVVGSELGVENQFLVWEVKITDKGKTTELYVDAGNGEVLGMDREDEGSKGRGEDENEHEAEGERT
ncbi:MAG: PepSY domain-containing protein [Gammaproteobacteria bacterium]